MGIRVLMLNGLFPLGNALLGDGNRSSLRPILAGELCSHSTVMEHAVVVSEALKLSQRQGG